MASLGGLTDDTTLIEDNGAYGAHYSPSGYNGDVWGFHDVPNVIEDFDPDVIYTTADPGTFVTASSVIPDTEKFLGYLPIEGEPIGNRQWRKMLRALPFFTCSKYGAEVVERDLGLKVDYVYHGIDHTLFNTTPRVNGMRDAVRRQMGWEDKFIITMVATNVRRKQIPRLIEAVSTLKHKYKQKDILLYLHMIPFNNYWLEGWNLPEITELYGVSDITVFHPLLNKFNASIPEVTGDPKNPGLAELYNASDLFVLTSQVEGFGLPIAEAMACGVPVLVPRYAAGWEVASPAGHGIAIRDWEIHKSGTKYANVDPNAVAEEIIKLKRNPREMQRMSEAGLKRAQDFSWDSFREVVVQKVEDFVNGDQSRYATKKENDTGEETRQEDGPYQEVQTARESS